MSILFSVLLLNTTYAHTNQSKSDHSSNGKSSSVKASSQHSQHQSHYAGQQKRVIKSLSDDDIQQLISGKGWGLAKAAELNGMPGPSHVLQMKNEIALTDEQEIKIKQLFDKMKSRAIPLGKKLVQLEKDLNEAFSHQTMTSDQLMQRLESISQVRKELRYVHLITHLQTPEILSSHQIARYNQLRGYSEADPCDKIPQGHDIDRWRKHNGCKTES